MKKLISLAIALILVLSLATTAFAATTDLTINDKTDFANDRSYEAHMILTASISGTNFTYKVNPTYSAILKTALALPTTTEDAVIIETIKTLDGIQMREFAELLYAGIQAAGIDAEASWVGDTTQLEQAYWLIVDVTDLDGWNYSNSLVMIDTVGDVAVEITNKPNTTVTTKKLDDENDSILDPSAISEDAVVLQDVADYDIGDAVPYTIDIDLASNIARYDYYAFVIQDSVEAGLTYIPSSFAITVRGVPKTIGVKGTAGVDFWYEIVTETDDDGNQTAQQLYVYPAHGYTTHELNTETADILDDYIVKEANKDNGGDFLKLFPADTAPVNINSSEVIFTYQCRLNENAVIGIAGNPNYYTLKFSNNPYDDSWGETAEDTNLVLTYKFIFDKVDGNHQPLTGADFDLYKFVAKYPADTTADTTNLVQHPYLGQWGTYEKIEYKAVSADGTKFTFSGLDDGLYRVEETQTPQGFKGIDPIEFRIIANHVVELPTSTPVLGSLQVNTQYTGQMTVNYNTAECSMSTMVENHSGAELPSTGGVGTTIFYVLGSVMVLGAVVILVTKKRMAV